MKFYTEYEKCGATEIRAFCRPLYVKACKCNCAQLCLLYEKTLFGAKSVEEDKVDFMSNMYICCLMDLEIIKQR